MNNKRLYNEATSIPDVVEIIKEFIDETEMLEEKVGDLELKLESKDREIHDLENEVIRLQEELDEATKKEEVQ